MRLLSFDELAPLKGITYSRAHLWRLEKEGLFPRRVRLGKSKHGWVDEEVDEWIVSRAALRNGRAA